MGRMLATLLAVGLFSACALRGTAFGYVARPTFPALATPATAALEIGGPFGPTLDLAPPFFAPAPASAPVTEFAFRPAMTGPAPVDAPVAVVGNCALFAAGRICF